MSKLVIHRKGRENPKIFCTPTNPLVIKKEFLIMSMQTYPMYDIGIVLVELLPYLNKAAMEMYPEQYGLSPEEEKSCKCPMQISSMLLRADLCR